jgi:enoyl-CoA hydratase/carnithine racemase
MSTVNKRLLINKVLPGYWRVTIDNPPINLYDPEMFAELRVLMDDIEGDRDLKVVVPGLSDRRPRCAGASPQVQASR